MAVPDPEAQAHALIGRIAAMLNDVHELGRQLEQPRKPNESPSAEANRVLYVRWRLQSRPAALRRWKMC